MPTHNRSELSRVYRPACVLHLTFRLDTGVMVARGGRQSILASDALDPNRQTELGEVARSPDASIFENFRVDDPLRTGPGGPQFDDLAPMHELRPPDSDPYTYTTTIIPESFEYNQPSLTQAGSFSLSIPWEYVPFDPRLVLHVLVEAHLGTILAENMVRAARPDTPPIQTRLNDGSTPNPETLQMIGFVEPYKHKISRSGSVVSMRGKDLIGLFEGTQADMATIAKIDFDREFPIVFAEMLSTIGADVGVNVNVVYDAADWQGSIPHLVDGGKVMRIRKRSSEGSNDKVTLWGLVVRYCRFIGATPYFHGRDLIIRRNRRLYDVVVGTAADPWTSATRRRGRVHEFTESTELTVDDNTRTGFVQYAVSRQFIIGRNVDSIEVERNMAPKRTPAIECWGIDDTARGDASFIKGRWPPKDSPAGKAIPSDQVETVPFPGITNQETLAELARDIYEQHTRGVLGGMISTRNLASFGGDNRDPDNLSLRIGDTVELLTARESRLAPVDFSFIDDPDTPFSEAVSIVAASLRPNAAPDPQWVWRQAPNRLGLRQELNDDALLGLAQLIVISQRSLVPTFLRYYKVTSTIKKWKAGKNGGITISFGFQNYVVSRHGAIDQRDRNRRAVETRAAAVGVRIGTATGYGHGTEPPEPEVVPVHTTGEWTSSEISPTDGVSTGTDDPAAEPGSAVQDFSAAGLDDLLDDADYPTPESIYGDSTLSPAQRAAKYRRLFEPGD